MRSIALLAVVLFALACSEPAPPVEDVATSSDADDPSGGEVTEDPEPEPEPEPEADVEPEPAPEPEPADDAEPEPEEAARRYFEAFATYRPADMQQMLEEATAGSPAAVYAEVQIAYVSALQQEGIPAQSSRFTVTDTGVELCSDDGAGGRVCTQFETLRVDSGKLQSFTVDGVEIAERLAAGGQVAQQGEATVELVGAYHSVQADSLVVALDVRNGSDQTLNLNPYSAEYVTVDGRQVTAADAFAPIDLRPGVSAYVALAFPAQGVGGTVYLTGYGDDFSSELEWELTLSTMGG